MTRTRLRQLEQIVNSETYDDQLNQHDNSGASTEGQPGGVIFAAEATTIVGAVISGFSSDLQDLGVNTGDSVLIAGSETGIVLSVDSVSQLTLKAVPTLTGAQNVSVLVDLNKNLERDLNHIRTQLRKLNGTSEWYELGDIIPASAHSSQTSVAVSADSPIDVGFNYNAGEPYDLVVFLNGEQLIPSTITGTTVTTERDYQELDSSDTNVSTGFTGRKVSINFDIISGDILQFNLSK